MTQPANEAASPESAMHELAEDPASRKRFLRMMGGAGAASAFAIFLAACGDDDDDASSSSGGTTTEKKQKATSADLEIVQYALTLEHLETDFYNAVLDSGVIKDKALGETAKMIRDNEQEHVDALTATVEKLGGKPMRPKTNFDAVLEGGQEMILQTAAVVENLGAAAYLGQAGRIQSKEILAAALAIHSVEARHAAALNTRGGQDHRPRRRLRQAGLHGGGPAAGQAVPRLKELFMTEHNLAAPELAAIDVQGINRQSFIMRGAVAAGAVYGLGAVGPFVRQAIAQEGGSDVDILNFALTLEYLEAAFYTQALKQVGDLKGDVKSLATEIRDNENEHVAALEMTIKDLGGTPVKAPGVDFGSAFANQKAFLKLAQTFEDTGVSAYNGAAPAIESKDVLAAAGSIVQIEARHAAAIRLLRGQPISDGGFDKSLEMQAVLDAVQPFVKS